MEKLHINEPTVSKYEVIFNFALQVFSVFYYIAILALSVILFIYSDLIIAIGYTMIMSNVVILQFRQAKIRMDLKTILQNQRELTFAVNAITQGRGIRRKISKIPGGQPRQN